jgi:glycosyltransferase involved in cell wall biosynthesis
MVAPPYYEVPPQAYGGIEMVVAVLVDALVSFGHRVTLASAGRNGTRAEHVRTFERPQHGRLPEAMPELVHAAVADRAMRELGVDVVHDHTDAGALLGRGRSVPTVVTVHRPPDDETTWLHRAVGDGVHLVSLSAAQRAQAPDLHWAGTVHNAVDPTGFPFRADKEDYVAFLGRMAPDKGAVQAVQAARAAGRRLVMAAKATHPAEESYFDREVRPLLRPGEVDWLGELDTQGKLGLLSAAAALLFPIDWSEPFGMVMIEAMACGTPVVALDRGAVPEVVRDGVTGIVCRSVEELPAALGRVGGLDPADCRRHVEEHFSPAVMARGYEGVYRSLLGDRSG